MKNEILPFLWFEASIEDVFGYYRAIFQNSTVSYVNPHSGRMKIHGFEFLAFRGGDFYKFTPAVSLMISCGTQQEIDFYWDKLTSEGKPSRCGWLQDKYGFSWQVVPENLGALLGDPDPEKARRCHAAMMTMQKLEVKKLEDAHRGS